MNLAELIRTTKGDRSYDDLARAAGGTPGRQRWAQLATKGRPLKNFPDPTTIETLATVLGVSQRKVILAAAESLGLDVSSPGDRLVDLLPPGLDELDEDERGALLTVARVLSRRRQPDYVLRTPDGVVMVAEAKRPSNAAGATHAEFEKDQLQLAAMSGTPAYAERDATGEDSQDPGHDDPV